MANKRMEFLIGFMVLTVFVTVAIMTILFGTPKKLIQTGGSQKMVIVFDKAPGIGNNSRVMKSGVEIGRVFKNELVDDKDHTEVRVYFKLNPDAKIYTNEYARINQTILGNAAIEFIKNPNFNGEVTEWNSSEAITGVPGGDIMGTVTNMEGDLAKTIQSINGAAKELTVFIGNLNNFLGTPEELNRKKLRVENIFNELNETLITTRNLASNMNAIVGDKNVQDNIRSAASNVPEILSKVDALISNANILADDFRDTIAKTHTTFDKVGTNLDNMENFTESLSENGPEFLAALNESGDRMKTMLDNISALTADLNQHLNNTDTPLGMLGDPEIGNSLRNTMKNVEVVSEKVQPIVDDARVFSNKIAHKPSTLIWGGRSYKGIPDIAKTAYNFQDLTPSGGTYSPLYTAPRSSCLGHLGKSCFSSRSSAADFTPAGFSPNGVSSAGFDTADFSAADEESMRINGITGDDPKSWEPGSVVLETPDRCLIYGSEKKCCGKGLGNCQFSLKKLFKGKEADGSADDGEYVTDGDSTGDYDLGRGEYLVSGGAGDEPWDTDAFADVSFPADCSEGECSADNCSAGECSVPNCAVPNCTTPGCTESDSYCSDSQPSPLSGMGEISAPNLLPEPSGSMGTETLPPSAVTPYSTSYQPSPNTGNAGNTPSLPGPAPHSAMTNTAPQDKGSDSFVDDGLPLLYMPN